MIRIGIWELDENFGIIGRLQNWEEIYLKKTDLWEISSTEEGPVWKWPVAFAQYDWCTPEVANDLNKTFFYAQSLFFSLRPQQLQQSLDMDNRTIKVQSGFLGDYLYETETEDKMVGIPEAE